MSLLINQWREIVIAIEQDFKEGNMSDDETKMRLNSMFDIETATLMWSRLYSARKHDNWNL